MDVVTQKNVDTYLNTNNIVREERYNTNKFDTRELIEIKNKKIKYLYENYNKYYNYCIQKIKNANNLKKTDIIFSVPTTIFNNNEYNSDNCINFIETKLKKHEFDTIQLSENSIFISWKYIELYITNE